jgi:ribonuclease T2
MRVIGSLFMAALLLAPVGPTSASDEAGVFDHYILALSWNSSWCLAEGDEEDRAQCDRGAGHAFTVHGLWPQHRRGWPEFCRSDERDPTRRQTAAMADIMGSGGLAWYQWRKHGRCSGLDGPAYLAATREAASRIIVPPGFERIDETVSLDPDIVERAFLEANEALDADGIVVTCRDGRLHEVRVCLDKSLSPIACTDQAGRVCRRSRIEIPPVR